MSAKFYVTYVTPAAASNQGGVRNCGNTNEHASGCTNHRYLCQYAPPPEIEGPSVAVDADAMDKLTDRYDVNPPLISDAMDQIMGINDLVPPVSDQLHVEMNQPSTDNGELCVETSGLKPDSQPLSPKSVLCVETTKLKECSVRLISLESILFPKPGKQHDT